MSGQVEANLYQRDVQVDEADDSPWTLRANLDGATERLNLEVGVYYWRVTETSFSESAAQYRLDLSAAAYPALGDHNERGNDARDAFDLGVVAESLVQAGGYVGPTDRVDFYRIELLEDAALTYTLKDLVNETRVQLDAFADDT